MSRLVPFPWAPLPTGLPHESGWRPGSCGHSGTLKDSPSDLSEPLSSLRTGAEAEGLRNRQAMGTCPFSHSQVSCALKVAPRMWVDTPGCPLLPDHWVQVS